MDKAYIAVMGYGTVGRSVAGIIDKREDTEVRYILEIPEKCTESRMVSDLSVILEDEDVSVVVDALPAVHPSYEFMKAALLKKKNVVTSNKAALAFGFEELLRLAGENGVSLRFEASCGGTVPDIAAAESLSRTNEITGCRGIMNGTTNYILDAMMRKDSGFEETLAKAQEFGYAEADPTADLSGYDVKNKLVILSDVCYHGFIDSDMPVRGIEKITKDILSSFKSEKKTVKLMGLSVRDGMRYAAGVVPTVISLDSMEAHIPENFNIFTLKCSNAGEIKLYGQGAGGIPTADAVVRDILDITGCGMNKAASFDRKLICDPALLSGKGYIGGRTVYGTLRELCEEAEREDVFFAFEPRE